jgi:hypothetical protein
VASDLGELNNWRTTPACLLQLSHGNSVNRSRTTCCRIGRRATLGDRQQHVSRDTGSSPPIKLPCAFEPQLRIGIPYVRTGQQKPSRLSNCLDTLGRYYERGTASNFRK